MRLATGKISTLKTLKMAILGALLIATYCLLCVAGNKATNEHQDDQATKANIEAELNSIMQQHGGQLDVNSGKPLAEAIISRFMVDNLTAGGDSDASTELESALESQPISLTGGQQFSDSGDFAGGQMLAAPIGLTGPIGPEAMKLKKLVSLLRNYEETMSSGSPQVFNQYPVLPAGQAATMKRAAAKIGAYLQQQQQQQQLQQPRLGYSRNNFDFGLGKRPDLSPSTVLRMGDVGGTEGQLSSISQYGKRPAAGHRFDFGLGKRVAQNYQRFDFGLGKRAPHGLRYDFGLGKKKK